MLEQFLQSAIIGVMSGVLSAFLFHCILKLSAPKILISSVIEKREVEGVIKYHIKIVNVKRRFLVNIIPYLEVAHHSNGGDGPVLRVKVLPTSAEMIPYIDPYCRRDSDKKYAVRYELPDNLLELWNDDSAGYLMFKIYCTDAFSGSGKLFCMEYRQHSCIVAGKFKTGKAVDIIPESRSSH